MCSYIMYFCIGFLISSGLTLCSCFWSLYVCHLALRMLFPLKSAKLFNSDYSRAIYIAEILFVLLIATIPSIVSAGLSKYKISSFPPTMCRSSGELHLYDTVIPIMSTLCFTIILMLLVLYKIHLVSF